LELRYRKPALTLAIVICLFAAAVLAPCGAGAQEGTAWWSSATWFDWSDHRMELSGRFMLARLMSGSVEDKSSGKKFDMAEHLGISRDPEPFLEFSGVFYVDRLAIRFSIEENHLMRGRTSDWQRLSELDMSIGRLGIDVNLLRLPFAAAGVNFDYYGSRIKFRAHDTTGMNISFESDRPMTIGLHGWAIPFRMKEVPVLVHARARFPFPVSVVTTRDHEVQLIDWEVGCGIRESVWDLSPWGFTTLSGGIEAGFRSGSIVIDSIEDGLLKASWQGLFVQGAINF
jgi:hypothetical protein